MLVRLTLAALAAIVLALPGHAHAELFKRMHRDYRRNNCWPSPFLVPDRVAVRAPFAVMINNGWRVQNTLGDEHFDSETGILNDAGRLKVRDILSYSPPQHRTVYILQATQDELTMARRRSVGEFVGSLHTVSEAPLVAETSLPPRGWPADSVSAIGTRFNATMPDPRLPPMTTTNMMGGSGGGGGGY
ncbi:MAG TPA: hypothetical protein VG826_30435 [Pirellulales bacterium]|nr:hypothetical protein [Pirellulales bacterium]